MCSLGLMHVLLFVVGSVFRAESETVPLAINIKAME